MDHDPEIISGKIKAIKEDVSESNLEEAISKLETITSSDELLALQSRLSKLKSDIRFGVLDTEESDLVFNQIRKGLLELVSLAEERNKSKQENQHTSSSESHTKHPSLNKDQQNKSVESSARIGMIGAVAMLIIWAVAAFKTELKWSLLESRFSNKLESTFPDSSMIRVEGGEFLMGPIPDLSSEHSTHRVEIPTFYISKFEVTQEQIDFVFQHCLNDDDENKYELQYHHANCSTCPAENIDQKGIILSLKGLNLRSNRNYRLATEAEWEYAASGGHLRKDTFLFSGGNDLNKVAWNQRNSGNKSHPVGQKQPNELGLFDMTGNVNEWVIDTWHDTYEGAPTNGSEWVGTSGRVIRGGGYKNAGETCLTTYRYRGEPDQRYEDVGFRIVLSADQMNSQ